MNFRYLAAAALLCAAAFAQADDFKLGNITIGHPFARATVAGQSAGGSFLSVTNQGADDVLLSATADAAADVQLHSMAMDGNVMRMRQIDRLPLPAGKTVQLAPGGYHFMLMGLKAPLKAGDSFPMTLKFEKAGEVTVNVKVEAAGR